MRRTVIIQCLLSLAFHLIHVSSLSAVRTDSSLPGGLVHRAVRGHNGHCHYHCHLGSTTTGRGRMGLLCGTAGTSAMTAPNSPSSLSKLWLPMQPAIRAANQLMCRVWESLKESGTIFTRCALKLTAAVLVILSMVISSPSTSRAARSDAKEAIVSQQSVKLKNQSKVNDNKKTQSKVGDNKKTQSKVDDNKKIQSKVDDSKKTQSKVDDNKKTQSKVADNKKTQSKVVDNKKTQSKVDDNKKTQSKVDDNKKTQSKVDDSKKSPTAKAMSLAGDGESIVRSRRLTNFGLLLVGCSALYVIATSGGNNSSSARRGLKKRADLDYDGFDDDKSPKSRGPVVTPPRRSPLGRRGELPKAPQRLEDLFGDLDETDPLFDDSPPPPSAVIREGDAASDSSSAVAKGSRVETSDAVSQQVPTISIPMGRQKMTSKLVGSQSDTTSAQLPDSELTSTTSALPPYAAIIAAPEESKLLLESASPTPAPNTAVTAPSKRQQQQPGILGRLFQKPGAGRPSDIRAALRPEQDQSHDFRVLVASSLTVYVPPGTVAEVEKGGALSSTDPDAFSPSAEVRQSALAAEMAYAGLSEQEAAESFADVASALIVQLVDKAVQQSEKGSGEQWEAAVVRSLDVLTDLIKGAGELFSKATPSAQIEPIQYNGKANKGKLENLYYYYARSAMDVKSMMGGLLGGLGGEDLPAGVDPAAEAADKADRLGKVQFLFNIKENKRSSIEQRITREVMMSVSKELSAGGGGDVSKMMEAFSGKGSPDLEDIMNQVAGSGGGGQLPPDMPNVENMSQAEISSMLKEAMSSVKQSLSEGTITRADVLEFEKLIGMDVKQFLGMMDSGRVDKRQLQAVSPDIADMVEVFRKLAAIK